MLDGVELKVIVDDGDVVVYLNGGVMFGKDVKLMIKIMEVSRSSLFGGGGGAVVNVFVLNVDIVFLMLLYDV